MPLLVLLRHAKAEAHAPDDHSRHLAPRGRADASAVRAFLEAQKIVPDHVVVSTAQRTRETWALAGDVEAVYDGRVYEAESADLREVIAETPAQARTLVLVGHNPGIERLAWELDDSETAREQTDRGLPTSGVAVFEVDGWDLAGARLREIATPRG